MKTFVIGTDHRGYAHKEAIKQVLSQVTWVDVGCFSCQRCDYPPYAYEAVMKMREGIAQGGVLLCGTGVGMSIAANRFAGIYAALAWNETIARASKTDDNANIIVLPADDLSPLQAADVVFAWMEAAFKEGRYQERIAMIDAWGGL